MQAGAQTGARENGQTAWLSRGFEELLYEIGKCASPEKHVFDVIIVGSGYGGAIAAAELAGCKHEGREISVCVLERGKEYLPGMFPSRLADLPAHVRFSTAGSARPGGRREGLFDVRVGEHVNAVVANGLGGGSLINAGVMEKPRNAMLMGWPGTVRKDLNRRFFDEASRLLGAHGRTIGRHPDGKPAKLLALEQLAPRRVREAPITVGLIKEPNGDGVSLGKCKRCGDCATGCNHGSKNSLDVSLLVRAHAAGAEIFTGATVLRIERGAGDGGWVLHTVHTDEHLRKRQRQPAALHARKLILAAGTFGSTEILLRSRRDGLQFSSRLGERFSTNGDSISVIYGQDVEVNAVADESQAPDQRKVGPTITGIVDLRSWWRRSGHVIEEIAIPGALRRVFEETVTTAKTLHELGHPDREEHRPGVPAHDPCAVDAEAIRKSSIVVIMGNDGAKGKLELEGGDDFERGDAAIGVRWPGLRHHRLYARQLKTLEKLARRAWPKARVLPNPLWRLLPQSMQFLFDYQSGPALTVHPLGGCPMGKHASDGVVDDLGQVYDGGSGPRGRKPWEGLVVLDGSIVRNALGINPALTIAALALRALEGLKKQWNLDPPEKREPRPIERPSFSPAPQAEKPRPTEIELVERMTGDAMLKAKDGRQIACVVELTLRFEKRAIGDLVLPGGLKGQDPVPMARELKVREGELRVFRKRRWDAWRRSGGSEERLARLVEVRAPLSGILTLLEREHSTYEERRCRAFRAWWLNRGKRDIWQALVPGRRETGSSRGWAWLSIGRRITGARALASRAGEVRQLCYDLHLAARASSRPRTPIETAPFVWYAAVGGLKRLTYARRANPWRQLMRMKLCAFPSLARDGAILELDTKYLAAEGVPLFRIASQSDQVSALTDLASFLGYFLRLIVNIHVWSFRRPDAAAPGPRQRLPGEIEGRLPKPAVYEIPVDTLNGNPVIAKLTRYLPRDAFGPPVVMIHGYSASGTTFAHPAVNPNMAEYFFHRKRDVWVLDLRTSSGMPTARHPWTFEQAALADLPAAVAFICVELKVAAVDVFAHCMGAAMFSMAVLAPPTSGPFIAERRALPGRIRKAVLSQIAPAVIMSPANIFRGYAMSYLRHYLPLENYEFEVRPDAGLANQLIDRLLATLPYPEEEFDIENPPGLPWRRTPFVGTRHRMDALYGRDFSLADKQGNALLDDAVLEHIDDLFGPLSIETVAQAIHFARTELITNRAGRNEYVLPRNMLERWTFPTLSIHGVENGLSDVATLERFRRKFKEEADIDIAIRAFPGFGHQDCLIGRNAEQVFAAVYDFLKVKKP